jgi:hypothetical protein
MKRVLHFLLFFLLLSFMSSDGRAQERLIPFEKEGKWGYRDGQGKVIIQPTFIMADNFSSGGIAAVVDDSGWAYINKRGNIVIRPFIFDNGPDYFEEGLARFTEHEKFGFFDTTGKIVIKPQFEFASPFHEELAAICIGCKSKVQGEHRFMEGGKWGYIDRKGEIIIPPAFESAGLFDNGKAQVRLNGKLINIDNKGKIIK